MHTKYALHAHSNIYNYMPIRVSLDYDCTLMATSVSEYSTILWNELCISNQKLFWWACHDETELKGSIAPYRVSTKQKARWLRCLLATCSESCGCQGLICRCRKCSFSFEVAIQWSSGSYSSTLPWESLMWQEAVISFFASRAWVYLQLYHSFIHAWWSFKLKPPWR